MPESKDITDRVILLTVIVFLGMAVLVSTVGGFYLAADGKTIPDPVIALGSSALGGLIGILVKTS